MDDKNIFYSQLRKACKILETTPTKVAIEVGLSPSTMTRYKNGSSPTSDILIKLSEYLGVSIDCLLRDVDIVIDANKTCEKAMSEASERINSINDELIHKISSKHLSISQDEREERILCIGRIVAEAYKDNNIDVFDSFSYPDFVVFLYSLYSHFSDYIKEYTAERYET